MGKNFILLFVLLFGLVGLGLLTGAFFAVRSEINFRTGAISVPGTVVDLEPTQGRRGGTLYKPVFKFTDRNDRVHRITSSLASSPPSFRRGEVVTVRYRPENPNDAHLDSFMESWFLPLILGGPGTVFTGIAAGFVVYAVRRRRLRSWLAINGMRVKATVEQVSPDTSIRVNGRNPWRITAQWQHPVSQKVYVFRSDAIWFDPVPYLQRETVDVNVNADNPRQYEMDISFLPKAG